MNHLEMLDEVNHLLIIDRFCNVQLIGCFVCLYLKQIIRLNFDRINDLPLPGGPIRTTLAPVPGGFVLVLFNDG
jgi:hypothetical protein